MMETFAGCASWARQEFGTADLGDARRNKRMIAMAARIAASPAGTVTAVFTDPADSQGAYDWIENDAFTPRDVAAPIHAAAARRSVGLPFVFVPTDGSSVTVPDLHKTKETGPIGPRSKKARGDKVHTALAVDPDGVPVGLLAQCWWTRSEKRASKSRQRRKTSEKETQYWLDARAQAREVLSTHAPGVPPWFQHDREADAWPVLLDAVTPRAGEQTTVRAAWDRRLVADEGAALDEPTRYLRGALAAASITGHYALTVTGGPKRAARKATMAVRCAEVTLDLFDKASSRRHAATVHVVCAREVGTTPPGEKPIEWLLLTTYPVASFEDACLVLFGYSCRWRIEEFHKAWKDGVCHIEDTQLRAHDHRVKWALLLAAVALRTVRLTYLARTQPSRPASEELSAREIEAMRDLNARRVLPPSAALTLAAAVLWIARLGGYTGTSSGGPPGMITIGRGLRRVGIAAQAAEGRAARRAQKSAASAHPSAPQLPEAEPWN